MALTVVFYLGMSVIAMVRASLSGDSILGIIIGMVFLLALSIVPQIVQYRVAIGIMRGEKSAVIGLSVLTALLVCGIGGIFVFATGPRAGPLYTLAEINIIYVLTLSLPALVSGYLSWGDLK